MTLPLSLASRRLAAASIAIALLMVGVAGLLSREAPTVSRRAPAPPPTGVVDARAGLPTLDARVFQRGDFIYGSEIGSWPGLDGRYDGHYVLDYGGTCPGCPELVRRAHVPVVKWAVWNVFDDMTAPPGVTARKVARAELDAVLDAIRERLGAYPMLKLQPGTSDPALPFCPERWGDANLAELNRQVVRQAGARVQLYEIANEMERACEYGEDSGVREARHWIRQVPPLKKYARSLGFEIFVGGPALQSIDGRMDELGTRPAVDFLQTIAAEYEDRASPYYHDPDLVPSFFSFHGYADDCIANETNGSETTELDCVEYYGRYVDAVRAEIDRAWGPTVGPTIRIAQTEWNFAQNRPRSPYTSAVWDARAPAFYRAMLAMFRAHNVWLANQFTISSNDSPMDMVHRDGSTTPYYRAFADVSTNDPLAR